DKRVIAKVVCNIANRVGEAVRACFTSDQNLIGIFKRLNQASVDLSGYVDRIRHISLNSRIVFGQDVAALGYVVHKSKPRLPHSQGGEQFRKHIVSRTTNQTMRRPDSELVASVLFQLANVVEGTAVKTRNSRCPNPFFHIRLADASENCRMFSVRVAPENRVGNMNKVMRIECDVDVVDLIAGAGKASHPTL